MTKRLAQDYEGIHNHDSLHNHDYDSSHKKDIQGMFSKEGKDGGS